MGNTERQIAYHRSLSPPLPDDWQPAQKWGPGNGKRGLSPGGIRFSNAGWQKDKFPTFFPDGSAQRVRLYPPLMDTVWRDVRFEHNFGPPLGDRYPQIEFRPSIWWSEPHRHYLCGGQVGRVVQVCLWYESVTEPGRFTSWPAILAHELGHIVGGPFEEAEIGVVP